MIRSADSTAAAKPAAPVARAAADTTAKAAVSAAAALGGDALAVGRRPRSLADYARFMEDQGKTNGCGTTSLGSIMSYWKDQPGAHNRREIDRVARAGDNTTSIQRLVSYGNDHGMISGAKNHASIADLQKYTDMGCPVQVLIEPKGGKDGMLHYVSVIGVETDAQGKPVAVKVADPDGATIDLVPVAKFEKQWSDLALFGIDTGIDKVMIVHVPAQPVMVRGKDGQVRSTADIPVPKGQGPGTRSYMGHLFMEAKNLWIRTFG